MRFSKFAVVGVANTAITFAVFNICAAWLHMPAAAANVLGWTAGFINSFLANRAWTFRDRGELPTSRVLPRFAVANLIAFGVSEVVVIGGQAWVSAWTSGSPSTLMRNVIEALAIACSLVTNYAISANWAFRPAAHSSQGSRRHADARPTPARATAMAPSAPRPLPVANDPMPRPTLTSGGHR
jgi:putative flippase GtrA